jgi:hypothetical protein
MTLAARSTMTMAAVMAVAMVVMSAGSHGVCSFAVVVLSAFCWA